MRFLRLIFSRFTLVFFAILLQIAVFAVTTYYFSTYFGTINVILTVITVLLMLTIINRDMSCDAKLPWCILVILLPVLGIILYVCFSRNYASKSDRKMFAKLPQLKLAEEKPRAPKKYLGQVEYLRKIGAPAFT